MGTAQEETPQEQKPRRISDDEGTRTTTAWAANKVAAMDLTTDEETGEDDESNASKEDNNFDDDDDCQPIDVPPPDFSMDDSLSKELLKLSFEKRNAIQEELHGVRCLAPEESEELIRDTMADFDRQLMERKLLLQQQININNATGPSNSNNNNNRRRNSRTMTTNVLRNVRSIAHDPANINSSSKNRVGFAGGCYLNDPGVRLRFLRCECFEVSKAVDRLVNFLELGVELFGDYVADRPPRISDFGTRKEEVALSNSRNQYLPFRDRSGRRVFVGVGSCDFNIDFDLRYKIMLYLHWSASEDVETQQKGVVIIAWPTNESEGDDALSWEATIRPGFNARLRTLQKKLEKAMPVRVVCLHTYFPDTPFFRAMSTLYYVGMSPRERILYKAHFGEDTELRYALLSYGIPEQLLPLSNTGTVKTNNHSRWINALRFKAERRHYLEQQQQHNMKDSDDEEEEIVDCPGSHDVIFRKGPTYKNNPGNMYFRESIEQTHEAHMKATRKTKCLITWNVVKDIESRNGRFLDWSKTREMWVVARDREKIRTKVAACYKRYNRIAVPANQRKPAAVPPSLLAPLAPGSTDPLGQLAAQQQQQQQQAQGLQLPAQIPSLSLPPMPSLQLSLGVGGALITGYNSENSNNSNNSRLREYYDGPDIAAKRRKTFSLFCGTGYTSSSDSSHGC